MVLTDTFYNFLLYHCYNLNNSTIKIFVFFITFVAGSINRFSRRGTKLNDLENASIVSGWISLKWC